MNGLRLYRYTFSLGVAFVFLAGCGGSQSAIGPGKGVPPGHFAYVVNGGSNVVSAYAINASSGALTQVTGSPFATGSGPSLPRSGA